MSDFTPSLELSQLWRTHLCLPSKPLFVLRKLQYDYCHFYQHEEKVIRLQAWVRALLCRRLNEELCLFGIKEELQTPNPLSSSLSDKDREGLFPAQSRKFPRYCDVTVHLLTTPYLCAPPRKCTWRWRLCNGNMRRGCRQPRSAPTHKDHCMGEPQAPGRYQHYKEWRNSRQWQPLI